VGCAAPTALLRPSYRYTGPTVILRGVEYMPLKLFCQALQYECDWDRFRGVATVRGEGIELQCLVDSTTLLVNGQPGLLTQPVRWYHGALMVPRTLEQFVAAPTRRPSTAVRFVSHHPVRQLVLDPGHGGKDPGAIGVAGIPEKRIVLDLTQGVARHLRNAGYHVSLTRTTDAFISLEERTRLAHQRQADFFISFHANANRSASLRGIEIYYLAPKSTTHELDRAVQQAKVVPLPYGRESLGTSLDTKAILWDLRNVEHRRLAIALGRAIAHRVAAHLGARNRGAKGARFHVLREAHMPAVLVEVGYLTHPVEGRRLADASYRQRLAQSVSDGIVAFLQEYERTDAFSQ